MTRDVVHLSVGWGPWPAEPFLDMLKDQCALKKLRCVICTAENVRQVIHRLETGRARVLLHLDFEADYEEQGDLFARLCYAAKDSGAVVVNEPDATKMCQNKAIVHYHFERAGIPVPYTVVVRNWEPSDFRLSSSERKRLARPFIIKPARGYGKEGVAKAYRGSVREIARARHYDRGDDFLLQKCVEPIWFGHRMGWFRAFHVLGDAAFCWWDTATEHYSPVTLDDFQSLHLDALLGIVLKVAQCSGMELFTTEVAAVASQAGCRMVAIDYINCPCDLTPKSMTHCGVPDSVVERVAERFAEAAWRLARGLTPVKEHTVWFAG